MSNFINNIVNKIKEEVQINKKIVHPENYYQSTRDLWDNLARYENALIKIKAKYNFEVSKIISTYKLAFKEKFGEELSPADFHDFNKLSDYCRRNKVSMSTLLYFKNEQGNIINTTRDRISEEVYLADMHLEIRDGAHPYYYIEIVDLEKKYGSCTKAIEYKRMMQNFRGKFNKRNYTRAEMTRMLAISIKYNIKPHGELSCYHNTIGNWVKIKDFIKLELKENDITIEEFGNDEKIGRKILNRLYKQLDFSNSGKEVLKTLESLNKKKNIEKLEGR